MKAQITISELLNVARERQLISLKLRDASRYIANAKNELCVNTTIIISQRVGAYQKGDEIVAFGKRNQNISELERQLRSFIGKGDIYIWFGKRNETDNDYQFVGEVIA